MTRTSYWVAVILAASVGSCTLIGVPPPSSTPDAGVVVEIGAPDAVSEAVSRGGDLRSEVRALWVVRTTLTHPDSIRLMVSRAAAAGFNTLLVQVRGRGDAFFESGVEPRSELLVGAPADFDPLAVVLREARSRDMDVHAWVNVHLVHGVGPRPVDRAHLVLARPDLLSVPRELATELDRVDPSDPRYLDALLTHARTNQDRVEGLFTSPSHPEVRDRIIAVVEELATRYALDGVHLDYVRHPGPDYDYAYGTRVRFRRWVSERIDPSLRSRLDEEERNDPLAYPEALPGLWSEFRRASMDDLLARVSDGLAAVRPGLALTAAVRADYGDAYAFRYQDWDLWLDRGWVDAVAPMAYTDRNDLFRSWLDDAVSRAGRERVWAGVGAYRTTYDGVVEQVRAALDAGVGGVALFSYDWAVAEGSTGPRPAGRSYLDALAGDAFAPSRRVE